MEGFSANSIWHLPQLVMKAHFSWKLKKAFAGKAFSFVSSSCLGGRFSRILAAQYRSPTVGLYFNPADYLSFISDLQKNLDTDLELDKSGSEQAGYPVASVNGIKIMLMHYASFDEARTKWNARKSRVEMANAFFIFTDRDGATYEHLLAFDKLPFRRKIVFVHKPYPEIRSAVYVKGFEQAGQVGELYSQWHRLDGALPQAMLKGLAA